MESYSNAAARWLALAEAGLSLCWVAGGILYLRSTRSSPPASESADRKTDQDQGHRT
jgi:hypothetical protein